MRVPKNVRRLFGPRSTKNKVKEHPAAPFAAQAVRRRENTSSAFFSNGEKPLLRRPNGKTDRRFVPVAGCAGEEPSVLTMEKGRS